MSPTVTLAGQLLQVCQRLSQIADQKAPNTATALAVALDAPLNSHRYFEAIALLNAAFEELVNLIDLLEIKSDSKNLYKDSLIRLRGVFTVSSLQLNWNQIRTSNLQDPDLRALHFLDDTLAARSAEPRLPQDDIEALKDEFNRLGEVVAKSALPEDVRAGVLSHIQSIVYFLQHYAMFGNRGLKRALQVATGEILYNFDLYSDDKSEVGGAFRRTVGKLLSALKVAESGTSVADRLLSIADKIGLLPPP